MPDRSMSRTHSNGGNLEEGDETGCDGYVLLDNGELLDDIAWYCGDDDGGPAPVGQLAPNAWGLYDTAGNVWEWCWDSYEESLSDATDPVEDGGSYRVYRSGSWGNLPRSTRAAFRDRFTPDRRYDFLGFRLARTIP